MIAQGSIERSHESQARALATLNGGMLRTFSQRTVAALRKALPSRLALPRIESFLHENVTKEAEKDAVVILGVGEMLVAGLAPGTESGQRFMTAGKQIDCDFLARVADFPVGIVIRYDEIEPVRMQRIESLQGAACRVLKAWYPARLSGGGRTAVRSAYSRSEFEAQIFELLRLYALETQVLSRSLRLPAVLVPLRERLAQSLYNVMDDVAVRLTNDLAGTVYRPAKSDHHGNRIFN